MPLQFILASLLHTHENALHIITRLAKLFREQCVSPIYSVVLLMSETDCCVGMLDFHTEDGKSLRLTIWKLCKIMTDMGVMSNAAKDFSLL